MSLLTVVSYNKKAGKGEEKMKKATLCVIFGGNSQEYEVSLRSVDTILRYIDREKYDLYIIGITKEGKWYLFEGDEKTIREDLWEKEEKTEVNLSFNEKSFITADGIRISPDRTLIMMHGEYGEDGRIQSVLDLAGIKYVGCDSFASSLCMDKQLAKEIAKSIGINVSYDIVINKNDYDISATLNECEKMGYPLFVKCARGGSSVGVKQVKNEKALKSAIKGLFELCPKLLIEKKQSGTETEVAILEKNGEILDTGCGQIKYVGEYYDYKSKYKCKQNQYIIPARIDKETEKSLLDKSKRLFFALGCKDLCRIDYFVTENGEIVFNEVNTLPGFTDISMYPMIMKNQGNSLPKLVDILLS